MRKTALVVGIALLVVLGGSPFSAADRNVDPGSVPSPVTVGTSLGSAHGSAAPSLLGGPPLSQGPRAASSAAPAPLGVADLGSGASSSFTTFGLRGTALIGSLATYNASLSSGAAKASLQLNAFLVFQNGSRLYDYWVQDVFEIDTGTSHGYFEDNIWNASSLGNSTLDSHSLQGNGTVTGSSDGAFYADVASASLPGSYPVLVYPTTVVLELHATLDPSSHPEVRFAFTDAVGSAVFDTVTFPFVRLTSGFTGFDVTSSLLSPSSCPRCLGDAEFVVGGPYGGFQTALTGPTNVELSLEHWTGHNFASVPDAVDYGVATAEGLENGSVALTTLTGGVPGAVLTQGTLARTSLWSAASVAALTVSVGPSASQGVAQVNGRSVPFTGGQVDLVLLPGSYNLTFVVGSTTWGIADLLLTAGEIETLEVGAIPLVFVPFGLPADVAWSVTVGNETLRGTGDITFGVANGSYNFSVPDLAQYGASPSSGAVSVNGTALYQNITWTPRAPSWESQVISLLTLRLGPVPLYVLLAGLTVFGIAAALLGRRRRRPPHLRPREMPGWDD